MFLIMAKKNEKLFVQADDTLLPCEFCRQKYPASELVLHETSCEPCLVSYAKPDLPEKSYSKQSNMQEDSAAFKSQNIHSAGGHSIFAKLSALIIRDASEHIEHDRKSKTGELPQSDESSETCPICKGTFLKEKMHRCYGQSIPCRFCNKIIKVAEEAIHLHAYCPENKNNRYPKTTVPKDSRSSNHKQSVVSDMVLSLRKRMSAKCAHCNTSEYSGTLFDHEKKCILRPISCRFCGHRMLLKEKSSHIFVCKLKKENVSCAIQREVPVIDTENCKDEDLSFLDTKEENTAFCFIQPDVSHSMIDKETPKDNDLSSLDAKDVTLLTEGMKELLIKGSDHDVKIIVKDKEFQAHRNILRTRSPVFAMILSHDTKESNTGTINIEDCDPDSFDEFLLYVYSGKTENLTPSKALHLYYTADKYDLPALKERCAILLKTSLSVGSICDVVLLAAKHGEKELLGAATEFFARNMREILVTVRWQEFLSENPVESNELYIKSMDILVPRK